MTTTTLPLGQSGPELAEQAQLFHALSDPRRLQILTVLRHGERCVCDLQQDLALAQSLLSFHLKTLRDAGLVNVRRSGRWAHYSLSVPALEQVGDVVAALHQPADDHPADDCCAPSPQPPSTHESKEPLA